MTTRIKISLSCVKDNTQPPPEWRDEEERKRRNTRKGKYKASGVGSIDDDKHV